MKRNKLSDDINLGLRLGLVLVLELGLGLVRFFTFMYSQRRGMSDRGNIHGGSITYTRSRYIPSQIDRLKNSNDAKNN